MNKTIAACLVFLALPANAKASFPIPLPFQRLVRDSTLVVRCTAIRITPLVPHDDTKVPAEASRGYLGPRCFTLIRVEEVWKKPPREADGDDDKSPDDSQEYLTIAHAHSSWGIRGISHDLTEGRSYILFLKKVDTGLYRMTDCNSAYTIADDKVPKMGVNMREEDVATSNPIPTSEFKVRILKEMNGQTQRQVSERPPDD